MVVIPSSESATAVLAEQENDLILDSCEFRIIAMPCVKRGRILTRQSEP
jgi:hypothetical protein